MSTLAKLVVSIGANSAEFQTELKKVSSQLKTFQKETAALDPMMNAIGTAIKTAGVAMVTAFVGAGTMALNSAAKIETYRLSLTSLMGSSQRAGEAVASALALASKTPFTDDQLLAASVALTKFGQDAKTVLPAVANMASATNGDVGQAAEAYGRFLLGQTKALSAYGINKAMVLAEGAKMEQGVQIANQKGQIVNEAAFETALLSLIEKRSKDGAALRANSIAGLKKSLLDVADDALRTMAGVSDQGDILAGGLADTFKKAVAIVIAKIEEWKANGSLQEWADNVGKAITVFFTNAKRVFDFLVDVAVVIARNWDAITPVIIGVVGAFVTFKVATAYVDAAALAVKLFGYAVNGTLGPLGWIMGAVALLSGVVVAATQKWREYNAVMNPDLSTSASSDNIDKLKAKLAQWDKDTAHNIELMVAQGNWSADQQLAYEKARANDRIVIEQELAGNITALRGKAISTQATQQAEAGKTTVKTATTTAGAVVAADTSAADARVKLNADLTNKIYDLTHTELQDKLHAIDLEAAADLKAGANAAAVAQWVAKSKAQINKDATTAQAAADKDAADKKAQAQQDAEDKSLASIADYVSKQKDVYSALTSAIIDNYGIQKNAAVTAVEKERDAVVNALDDMIDKRQDQLNSTLDAISREKAAALGQYDAQIQALEDEHAAGQRADTLAGLRLVVASAATAEDLARAQKALSKELADEAYNDKLDSLRKQKQAASDTYDAETTAAQTAGNAQIQALKDQLTATQVSYADRLTSVQSYYDTLMLQRNADAEAEKLLAGKTQTDIITMLQNRLSEWAALGTQIGDSMYSGLQSALGALASLGATNVPGTSTPMSPTWNQGAGQAGYGNFPVHALGGYFTTPHIGVIAEKGPEFVVPQSQASSFARQMGGDGATAAQQRQMMFKMDAVLSAINRVAPGVGSVINGLGRA